MRLAARSSDVRVREFFRTAAEPDLLPGRVAEEILDRWDYQAGESRRATLADRSSIYGGFHLYRLKNEMGGPAQS